MLPLLITVVLGCSEYGLDGAPPPVVTVDTEGNDGYADMPGVEETPEGVDEPTVPGIEGDVPGLGEETPAIPGVDGEIPGLAEEDSDDDIPSLPGVDGDVPGWETDGDDAHDGDDLDDGPNLPGIDEDDIPGFEDGDGPGDGPDLPGIDEDDIPDRDTVPEFPDSDGDGAPDPRTDLCADGILVDFTPGEIAVLSWSDNTAWGELDVPVGGVYNVYNTTIAESGDSQRNETAYVRIPNASNPSGLPEYGNCNDEWIIEDGDNAGTPPAGTTHYVGTFTLDAGLNTLEFNHYCPLYRSGECGQFHDTVDSDKTCDSNNVNSVHFFGDALCLYPM